MIDYFRNHKYRPRKPWWEFSLSKQEQARCLSYIAGKPDAVSERFAALKLTEKELHKHTMIETIPFSLAHYRNRQEFFFSKTNCYSHTSIRRRKKSCTVFRPGAN